VLVATAVSGCAARSADVRAAPGAGQVDVRTGRAGLVVASLHSTRDASTDEMAVEIARRTGFGLVVASGFPVEEDSRRVLEAAQGPLRFYAEIHGGHREPCTGRIDITTVGVDPELAKRLRSLAELIRDAHLRGRQDVQRLEVLVEPVERVGASGGRGRADILRLPQRGLLIELPRCPRRDWRDTYTAILADFLAQAVTLPVGR
jgi:hypothetical protein